jgi:hypothetical protein
MVALMLCGAVCCDSAGGGAVLVLHEGARGASTWGESCCESHVYIYLMGLSFGESHNLWGLVLEGVLVTFGESHNLWGLVLEGVLVTFGESHNLSP